MHRRAGLYWCRVLNFVQVGPTASQHQYLLQWFFCKCIMPSFVKSKLPRQRFEEPYFFAVIKICKQFRSVISVITAPPSAWISEVKGIIYRMNAETGNIAFKCPPNTTPSERFWDLSSSSWRTDQKGTLPNLNMSIWRKLVRLPLISKRFSNFRTREKHLASTKVVLTFQWTMIPLPYVIAYTLHWFRQFHQLLPLTYNHSSCDELLYLWKNCSEAYHLHFKSFCLYGLGYFPWAFVQTSMKIIFSSNVFNFVDYTIKTAPSSCAHAWR